MRERGGGAIYFCLAHSFIKLMTVRINFCAFVHFLKVRGVASCSSLVSFWMLMKFSSLNLTRKTWILVSRMGYMDWGVVLVGDVGGLGTVNWGGGGRLLGNGPNCGVIACWYNILGVLNGSWGYRICL